MEENQESGSAAAVQPTAAGSASQLFRSPRDLEYPFIKAPFESYNKIFRQTQKTVESQFHTFDKAIKEISKKKTVSSDDACRYLNTFVQKLRGVKRKLEESNQAEIQQLNVIRKRLDHLDQFPTNNQTSTQTSKTETDEQGDVNMKDGEVSEQEIISSAPPISSCKWNQIRVNRILVDYLLRNGHYKAATKLAEDSNILDFVDVDIFLKSQKVIDGLKNKDCREALEWCSDNKSKLKKMKTSLEFNLRLQEFFELVKQDKNKEAIQYSRKYLNEFNETNFSEICRAMGAIAFGKNTTVSPYKELFSEDRWNFLIEQFHLNSYMLHSLTTAPLLHIFLQAGLSSLKVPQAYIEEYYNMNDPLCHPEFQELAKDLPFAFHQNSKIVCRITGKLMNDDNYPVVLPNGNVYSVEAMKQIATQNHGIIVDPRTKENFVYEELKKAIII